MSPRVQVAFKSSSFSFSLSPPPSFLSSSIQMTGGVFFDQGKTSPIKRTKTFTGDEAPIDSHM